MQVEPQRRPLRIKPWMSCSIGASLVFRWVIIENARRRGGERTIHTVFVCLFGVTSFVRRGNSFRLPIDLRGMQVLSDRGRSSVVLPECFHFKARMALLPPVLRRSLIELHRISKVYSLTFTV
jgi:hypothetical protein